MSLSVWLFVWGCVCTCLILDSSNIKCDPSGHYLLNVHLICLCTKRLDIWYTCSSISSSLNHNNYTRFINMDILYILCSPVKHYLFCRLYFISESFMCDQRFSMTRKSDCQLTNFWIFIIIKDRWEFSSFKTLLERKLSYLHLWFFW